MESAGGKAINGTIPILDIQPKSIHERCPVFLGSAEDVDEIRDMYLSKKWSLKGFLRP